MNRLLYIQLIHIFCLMVLLIPSMKCCTNFLLTPESTATGETIISYNADSWHFYRSIAYFPKEEHKEKSKRKIYDWETGAYRGEIAEVESTFHVIGNMNEYEVTITESTFGGVEILLHQSGGILDYGSLIYLTLQRSKSALAAIHTMTSLTTSYGYGSKGESFSIGDTQEVWYMELIGRGEGELGAVYVAIKLPPGTLSAHANQARITTFPRDSPDCLYSPDIVQFARGKGLFGADTPESEFSFSAAFDPVHPSSARLCDGRVWSFFREVADGMEDYLTYIKGYDMGHRLPLYVTPTKYKPYPHDILRYIRNHYENTYFDQRKDIGAQAYNMPYRFHPVKWDYNDTPYLNERPVSIEYNFFSLVAVMRSKYPWYIGGLQWFGADDPASSPHFPLFLGTHGVPWRWKDDLGNLTTPNFDSAYWVGNLLSNYFYSKYELVHPEIKIYIEELELEFRREVTTVEAKALDILDSGGEEASIRYVSDYSHSAGNNLVVKWLEFFAYLFTKYMDGNVKTRVEGSPIPNVQWPGYPAHWYQRIVNEDGQKYRFPT